MNVTVVTPFDSANYGAFLQAYCLKRFLENNGHTVKHVRTRSYEYVQELYYHNKPKSRREKFLPGVFRKQKEFGQRKLQIFKAAQACFDVVEEISDTDVVVVGSDEIWNVKKPAFQKSVFWGDAGVPTISYAPSIGNARLEEFETFPDQIQQLQSMKAVMVRDNNTAQFVRKYTSQEPVQVCDPTMLIQVDSYGDPLEDRFVDEHECILIYAYRLSNDVIREIKKYAKTNGLKTVACCFQHDWCDYQCECNPLQFSSLIRKCRAVVTTTFHGTIFSVLNHANFVCLPKSVKTTQLLEQLNLMDRALEKERFHLKAITTVLNTEINYGAVEAKIEAIRSVSATALKSGLAAAQHKDNRYNPMICFPNDCSGCFACANVCSRNAIAVYEDEQGRTLPHIDMDRCVACGACKKVCPRRMPPAMKTPSICYAAQRKERQKMAGSSSGGIGALLAESFMRTRDAVCGAVVENGRVVHRVIQDEQGLDRLKGSKYVQSDLLGCYEEIKATLKQNKKVLFVGTPCQVAAMKNTFGRYDGFYGVDLVCHGVAPQKYLHDHITHITEPEKVDNITFRSEPVDYLLRLCSEGKMLYEKHKNEDVYFYAFMKGVSCRENCYNCPYAKEARCGDLTIGDFWRLNRATLTESMEGKISLVFVNTEKGKDLFEMIKEQLVYEQRSVAEAVNGNAQLRRPSDKHKYRKIFLDYYARNRDFTQAVTETGIEKEMRTLRKKQQILKLLKPVIGIIRKK